MIYNTHPLRFCTVPPTPQNVVVKAFGVSWIAISWHQDTTNAFVSGYIVLIEGPQIGQTRNVSVDQNVLNVNITSLEFGVYTLRVIAIGIDGQLSPPSPSLTTTTTIPGNKIYKPVIDPY